MAQQRCLLQFEQLGPKLHGSSVAAVDCGLQLSCCVRDWACLEDCLAESRDGAAAMLAGFFFERE
jgi:hypothetical protein